MNTFKRKTLSAAVAAGLGAMALAGSAGAVQLSQDGTGSALIYPYYTVRTAGNGEYNTYVNVVNTTNSAKVVKVRFLEGKNSREVLDFNLWLSPQDVWAGVITPTATGANLASRDQSCVTRSGGVDASSGGSTTTAGAGFNFTNINYTSASGAIDPANLVGLDGADTTLDRTREGYIEIIEMGVVSDTALALAVTHNSAGIPNNCGAVPVVDSAPTGTAGGRIAAGTGGLMGGATLINVNNGSDFGYDPVVLEDFNPDEALFRAPGTIEPTLNNAVPVSNVFYYHPVGAGFVTDVLTSTWAAPVNLEGAAAVSAVMNRVSVMNNYVLDTATNSSTDWVLTFPTKRHFVAPVAATGGVNTGSFAEWSEFGVLGSCGVFTVTPYDREEQSPGAVTPDIPELSPTPVPETSDPSEICWESTVVNFHPEGSTPAATDTLLGSTNGRGVPVPYEHGWARLNFTATAGVGAADGGYTPVSSAAGTTYSGVPVVGFMVQDFLNPNVTIGGLPSASSYGGNFNHRFERVITGTGVTVAP